MEEDVGQHGRRSPTVRGALVRGRQRSRFVHAGLSPLADPPQYPPLLDPWHETRSPQAMVNRVETSTAICLPSPIDGQLAAWLPPLVQRLMGTVALPDAVGKGINIMRAARLPDHSHCPLDALVLTAGLPSWPLLPPCLLAPYPFDRRRDIPIGAKPLVQVPAGVVQVCGVLLRRDLGPPWRTVLPGETRGFPQTVTVNQGQHVVEPHVRRALCLFRHPLELHGYGG